MPPSHHHPEPGRPPRSRRAPVRAACLAIAVALLSCFAWAGAARSLVQSTMVAWPRGEPVRVFDASGWPRTVRTAAGAWNRTSVTPPIRFVSSREDAAVVVESGDRLLGRRCAGVPDCEGHASRIGWRGGGRPALLTLPGARAGEDAVLDEGMVQLAAHELGHVLGLGHEPGACELMHPGGVRGGCPGPLWTRDLGGRFLCGPFGKDLARAERLYRRPAAAGYSPWCGTAGAQAPAARSGHRNVENP